MGIPAQIKTDNAPTYVSIKLKQFFEYYNIKHINCIPDNPTGQAVVEKSNCTLIETLHKQAGEKRHPNTDYIMLY